MFLERIQNFVRNGEADPTGFFQICNDFLKPTISRLIVKPLVHEKFTESEWRYNFETLALLVLSISAANQCNVPYDIVLLMIQSESEPGLAPVWKRSGDLKSQWLQNFFGTAEKLTDTQSGTVWNTQSLDQRRIWTRNELWTCKIRVSLWILGL